MTLQELVGQYTVIGNNQDAESNSYKGKLFLSLDINNRIVAKWLINNQQEQFGYGFFKENILVLNFKYTIRNNIYKGVIIYKCISKDILEGFWTEEHGDPKFIGEERCFRINNRKEVIN